MAAAPHHSALRHSVRRRTKRSSSNSLPHHCPASAYPKRIGAISAADSAPTSSHCTRAEVTPVLPLLRSLPCSSLLFQSSSPVVRTACSRRSRRRRVCRRRVFNRALRVCAALRRAPSTLSNAFDTSSTAAPVVVASSLSAVIAAHCAFPSSASAVRDGRSARLLPALVVLHRPSPPHPR